jgi:catechol 2,3-dioxygenase-like lactoylglutathione lyase family enzyme
LTSVGAPSIVQIVLGSDDLPFCKHFYTTVFGFAGAGERLIYSEHNGQVMGLGGWGGASVLYLVGRQELMQLEFWTHTTPRQRSLPADWQPNDIGFCRLGISVPDFNATLERLESLRVTTLTAPIKVNGLRRVCFRDPTVGIPVEIMEEGDALPGVRDRYHVLKPAIVYAAVSVTDLDEALAYFGEVVGLVGERIELHSPEHEALWALPNATRKVAILRGGTTYLEIVEYETPAGRNRPLDDRLDRQGFKTVAVGYRDPVETEALFQRVKASGLNWTVDEPVSFIGGNHVIGAVAHRMKTLSVPRELERRFGYSPEPAKWWRPARHTPGEQPQGDENT